MTSEPNFLASKTTVGLITGVMGRPNPHRVDGDSILVNHRGRSSVRRDVLVGYGRRELRVGVELGL